MRPVPLTPECPRQEEGDTARLHEGISTDAVTPSLCHTSTQSLQVPPVYQAPSGAPRFLPHGRTPKQAWIRGRTPPEASPTGSHATRRPNRPLPRGAGASPAAAGLAGGSAGGRPGPARSRSEPSPPGSAGRRGTAGSAPLKGHDRRAAASFPHDAHSLCHLRPA